MEVLWFIAVRVVVNDANGSIRRRLHLEILLRQGAFIPLLSRTQQARRRDKNITLCGLRWLSPIKMSGQDQLQIGLRVVPEIAQARDVFFGIPVIFFGYASNGPCGHVHLEARFAHIGIQQDKQIACRFVKNIVLYPSAPVRTQLGG